MQVIFSILRALQTNPLAESTPRELCFFIYHLAKAALTNPMSQSDYHFARAALTNPMSRSDYHLANAALIISASRSDYHFARAALMFIGVAERLPLS